MRDVVHELGPFTLEKVFDLPDSAGVTWEKFRDGIEIHRLYDTNGGQSAALLRYAPGARLQRHVHVGHEHILILRGSQIDDSGPHPTGTLLVYAPGTSHSVRSDEGCVVMIIWERPVSFIPPTDMEKTPSDTP